MQFDSAKSSTKHVPVPEQLKWTTLAELRDGDEPVWELRTAQHNGYEHAVVFHRGEVAYHTFNHYQPGVKDMPLSAVIRAQSWLICNERDLDKRINGLECLNNLARIFARSHEDHHQGRLLEWANRAFPDAYEAADELHHGFMLMQTNAINVWKIDENIDVKQFIHWGTGNICYAFTCKHEQFGVKSELTTEKTFPLRGDHFFHAIPTWETFKSRLTVLGWLKRNLLNEDARAETQRERIQREHERRFHGVQVDTSKISQPSPWPADKEPAFTVGDAERLSQLMLRLRREDVDGVKLVETHHLSQKFSINVPGLAELIKEAGYYLPPSVDTIAHVAEVAAPQYYERELLVTMAVRRRVAAIGGAPAMAEEFLSLYNLCSSPGVKIDSPEHLAMLDLVKQLGFDPQ